MFGVPKYVSIPDSSSLRIPDDSFMAVPNRHNRSIAPDNCVAVESTIYATQERLAFRSEHAPATRSIEEHDFPLAVVVHDATELE
jgi:hypothetical protein